MSDVLVPRARVGAMCDGTAEKVGVARIRLSRARDNVSVMLGSFRDADLCIAGWAKSLGIQFVCNLDIRFSDGKCGSYTVTWDPSSGRPSVSRYMRAVVLAGEPLRVFPSLAKVKSLECECATPAGRSTADLFLDRYELSD